MHIQALIELGTPYLPSGYCYLWDGPLVSLHVMSDLIVGIAFLLIPFGLLWFVGKRRDVPFQGLVLWFSAFLVSCAATKFLGVWNLWHEAYWLAGATKAVAAITAAATAGYLVLLLPKAVTLPSPGQMKAANDRLAQEIAGRERVMKQLQTLNQELESRVHSRTEELEAALREMQKENGERRSIEEALRRWEAIFAHAGWGVALADPESYRLEAVNPAFAAMHGWLVEELTGKSLEDVLAPEWRPKLSEMARATDDLGHAIYEADHIRKDGTRFPVLTDIVACKDATGRVRYRAANFQDITGRKRVESERHQATERLTRLLRETEEKSRQNEMIKQMSTLLQTCASTPEAFQVVHEFAARLFPNDSGALCLLNPSVALMEAAAMWGEPLRDTMFAPEDCWSLRTGRVHISTPDGVALHCTHVTAAPGTSYVCVPMVAHNESIGVLSVQCGAAEAGLPLEDRQQAQHERENLAVNFAADIALALANLRLRETLRTQSTRDPLTGLFNRRYLTESLDREVRRADRGARPLGIVMLDLDQFKPFNDAHGHEAGDALLRSFGRFIQKNTRGEDVACRYGGDEFVILLVDADLEVARRRAEELREGFSRMVVRHLNHKLDSVSFSMGVAAFPLHGATSDDLLAAADEALYDAKAQGRNRVSVYRARA